MHWQLTGEQVLGVGDASGMFPIDVATGDYDAAMITTFDQLAAEPGPAVAWPSCCPTIRTAGEAGRRAHRGRRPADSTRPEAAARRRRCARPRGTPAPAWSPPTRSPRAPATSAPAPASSPWSCSSSELSRVHHELDLVTTPAGDLVAMVHCNNGASELNAWVGLFAEFARALGADANSSTVFETLFRAACEGEPDGGGLLAYNYLSGEPITGLEEGRPLFLRSPDSTFDLATFMRTQLFSSLATLRIGMDVLQKDEGVRLDRMFAHGGLFKTKGVAQRFLAAAIDTPVVRR